MTNIGRAWFEDIAGRDPDHERVYRVREDDQWGFLIGRVIDNTTRCLFSSGSATPALAKRFEAQPFDRTRYQRGRTFDDRQMAIRWLIDQHVFPATRNPFASQPEPEPEPERPASPSCEKSPPDQGSLF